MSKERKVLKNYSITNMKKNTHTYSRFDDYAPVHSSTPTWKFAVQYVGLYTLMCIGIIALGHIVLSVAEFMVK